METSTDREKFSKAFLSFGESAADSKLYHFLAPKVASDPEILEIAAVAQPKQPPPNLLFAAVNFLLYRSTSEPLSRFYPNQGGKLPPGEEMYAAFREFCLRRSNDLKKLIRFRTVQTNEVRRCALLAPAVALAARSSSEIALIDVGTSSGLNLLLDRYFYRYSNDSALGDPSSSLSLSCELRGAPLPVGRIPRIATRVGIDLNPIDLADPDEVLWMISLIWPDQLERIDRLKAALRIRSREELQLVRGDALSILPSAVEIAPTGLPLCIMHSHALNQFGEEGRQEFERMLCSLSKTREISRVGLEWLHSENAELTLVRYSNGSRQSQSVLAKCHSHGVWMDWHRVSSAT